MKIDFVTSFYGKEIGGVEVSTKLLGEILKKRLSRLRIFTTRRVGKKEEESVFSIPQTQLIPPKLLILGNTIIDKFIAFNLEKILREDPPALIHVQDTYILPATLKVANSLEIPIVATMRNNVATPSPTLFPLPYMFRQRDLTIVKNLSKTNAIVSVSESIKRELISVGIDSDKVHTIHLDLIPQNWISSRDVKKSDEITLFSAGRIYRYKGFGVLTRAMKTVTNKKKNIRLLLIGDGPYKKELNKLIRRLNLSRYIKLLGKTPFEKIGEYYSHSDIVIVPSVNPEPFGRVALEAMSAGKPVVASKVGGIPEIVENGVTGILVPPDNPRVLSNAIIKLIEDETLRNQMGENAKEIINKKFNPNRIVSDIIELYQRVLKEKFLERR